MRAASRLAKCAVIIAAAGASAAYAVSPVSNGVGDGEANVPFASPFAGAREEAGRAAAGVRDPGDRGERRDRGARQRDRDRDAAGRDRDRAPGSDPGGASRESPYTGP